MSMKKTLLFILTAMVVCMFTSCKQSSSDEPTEQNIYVDLGLPSGTLWKNQNEQPNPNDKYGFYTYDEAVSKFGYELPTKEQCQELIDECSWSWTFGGYKVTGPNRNYIILPPDGENDCDIDTLYGYGITSSLWSATPYRDEYAYHLYYINDAEYHTEYKGVYTRDRCKGYSVRLVR